MQFKELNKIIFKKNYSNRIFFFGLLLILLLSTQQLKWLILKKNVPSRWQLELFNCKMNKNSIQSWLMHNLNILVFTSY